MLNKRIEEAINAQINAEFWSAYLYLSMSTYFEAEGKSGFANWFRVQFKEEQAHAEILMNYVQDRGGRVELRAIEAVPTTWNSALDAFEATLAHENKVTALLNNLYAIAEEEKDYATRSMLTWFIDEQVEEEKTAQGYIDNLRLIGDNGFGIYTLDKELAARVFNTPAPLANK
jgi:ferritin